STASAPTLRRSRTAKGSGVVVFGGVIGVVGSLLVVLALGGLLRVAVPGVSVGGGLGFDPVRGLAVGLGLGHASLLRRRLRLAVGLRLGLGLRLGFGRRLLRFGLGLCLGLGLGRLRLLVLELLGLAGAGADRV